MSGMLKWDCDAATWRHPNGSQATTGQQHWNGKAVASTLGGQAFNVCFLNGLNFGKYDLIDPVSTDTANNNCPNEFHAATSHHHGERGTIANLDITVRPRPPFVLNDELEAEAQRRRVDQPIRIPERRFGHLLSNEFSLRFRYWTSWHCIP